VHPKKAATPSQPARLLRPINITWLCLSLRCFKLKNIKDKVEVAANLCIIVTAVLLCGILVKPYILPVPILPAPSSDGPTEIRGEIKRGDKVTVSGIDWRKSQKTLLLALSTACHFCTESSPFYRRLVNERTSTRLVALVPQAEEEGRAYLRSVGVGIDEVRHVTFKGLGLTGTPTLLLVDENGVVSDVWVGALTPNKEEEVISRLGPEQASK
jgi:hypothetical protein